MTSNRHLGAGAPFWTALAIALLSQGCLLWRGEDRLAVPDHPVERVADPQPGPRIRWVIYNSHRGSDEGAAAFAGAKTHTKFKRALEGLQRSMPFLAKASEDESDPEFLLVLSTGVEERGNLNAFFSGLTLGVIPWYIRSDVIVGATLQTVEGVNLISHRSSIEIRGISEILLLPLLPWTLTHPLGDEIYVDPMRSAIDAVAADFSSLPSQGSHQSPRSAASRDTTE